MRRIALAEGADLDGFRRAVRSLVAANVPPGEAVFEAESEATLFGMPPQDEAPALRLPRALGALIDEVVPHRDPKRYGLLYRTIWRVLHGERGLLEVASDPVMHRLGLMARSVRRDIHKMHAYLRFRRVDGPAGEPERYAAWFEPDHFIVEAAAPFFVDRFQGFHWLVATPVGSARWDGRELSFGPPGQRHDAPAGDAFEAGWTAYYSAIFNPARTNPDLMRSHMAKKYWRNLPEAVAIPHLVRSATRRTSGMIEREATMPAKRKPEAALAAMQDQAPTTLAELNRLIEAAGPLVPGATQAVFGEGPMQPDLALVGEQPGDEEDLKGRPFVGPAGQLLDRALDEARIDRSRAYLTNAVKHFKFEQRGKRRLHSKPTAGEVSHYRWWLDRELELVQPKLVVALGATAVLALAGKAIPVTRARGPATFLHERAGFITVHPSYLLRLPDAEAKAEAYDRFVADLREAKSLSANRAGRRAA
jgi:DNA polymerase